MRQDDYRGVFWDIAVHVSINDISTNVFKICYDMGHCIWPFDEERRVRFGPRRQAFNVPKKSRSRFPFRSN